MNKVQELRDAYILDGVSYKKAKKLALKDYKKEIAKEKDEIKDSLSEQRMVGCSPSRCERIVLAIKKNYANSMIPFSSVLLINMALEFVCVILSYLAYIYLIYKPFLAPLLGPMSHIQSWSIILGCWMFKLVRDIRYLKSGK